MRYDMDRVVIERPRVRGGAARKGRTPRDLEELPKHQGMRRPYIENSKEFSDLLGPLFKFLQSRAGKPWDKVYSEICKVLNKDSVSQAHVFNHIWGFVAKDTFIGKDGKIYRDPANPSLVRTSYYELYIHPKTGILCRTPHEKIKRKRKLDRNARDKQKTKSRRLVVSKYEQLHKLNGIWYSVLLAELPTTYEEVVVPPHSKLHKRYTNSRRIARIYATAHDVVTNSPLSRAMDLNYQSYEIFGMDGVYGASKRQLSSRELKRYKIKNEVHHV